MIKSSNTKIPPVFIHSLFRSGSTYLFNVFRRSDSGYWCYQEPLNEVLLALNSDPELLLKVHNKTQNKLRHPCLDKPYFHEFYVVNENLKNLLHKGLIYDQYFLNDFDQNSSFGTYISALLSNSKAAPVLQFCRTTGRVRGMTSVFRGIHIYLYRNPWDQWLSYKTDACFDVNNLLICNAHDVPSAIENVRNQLKIPTFHSDNINFEQEYFGSKPLDSSGSYKLFYLLWCHAMLEARPHCQISIDIDRLSVSDSYQKETLQSLNAAGLDGLDFTDCAIPMIKFGSADCEFFNPIENCVHALLLANGHDSTQVAELNQLSDARNSNSVTSSDDHYEFVNDAIRARENMRRIETRSSILVGNASSRLNLEKRRAEHAETTLEKVERRFEKAERRFEKVERMLAQERRKLLLAEKRTTQLLSSSSWKVTSPLRWAGNQAYLLRQNGISSRMSALFRETFGRTVLAGYTASSSMPKLRRFLAYTLRKIGVYDAVITHTNLANRKVNLYSEGLSKKANLYSEGLSANAREIYFQLEKAMSGISRRRK